MMEPSSGNGFLLHAARENPPQIDKYSVVEAFGRRKCPKLVEQVQEEDVVLRVNALKVLCDEFRNPISVQGCIDAGVLQALHRHIKEGDDETRVWSSKALYLAAEDSNGRAAMLAEDTAGTMFPCLDDASVDVRNNILSALCSFSAGVEAVHRMVNVGYPAQLVTKAAKELASVKPLVLKLLRNLLKDERGLNIVLDNEGVETCHGLLRHGEEDVRTEAAQTLGFMCFAGLAKATAIGCGAVGRLVTILVDKSWRVRAAAAYALMVITIDDEGKKAFLPAGGVQPLLALLGDEEKLVRLNALKVMASVAVHPEVRAGFLADESCLERLEALTQSPDTLLAKHAIVAKDAVLWEP
uniref:Radial spoke protein 8 n=1 Tax=Phaeomonas parva TaxID=124430 RepID=A0A7S1XJA5_9STRA|mmetsp:Transcript_13448/g.39851  ORF Transcript_13448/g.39851 Transcript_13448/m.39851 type:complete len:354 (+) Transcript_13448:146-1207(+)|eukprot:CAMPEP_0118877020 /NCGR_PEP_ID=MMETSP1163-20130328/17480_1 /TAXON_ID=124430 /ORGANISM="Phaeomonas parva, Strain CCMP2877" /LENGTH=353 /DNA_ID=CAMNT_0006812695 /DNA_START=80 /DNA_END=1141 /DNA_ORIENTATION=+